MEFVKNYMKIPTKVSYFSSGSITHLQMYKELNEKSMFIAKLIGANIFDQNYRVFNIRFKITLIFFFSCVLINIYDIYIFRADLVRCMFCMITMSAAGQVFTKLYSFLFLIDNCKELKDRAEKLHQNFKTVQSAEIFEKWMMIATHTGAFLTSMYLIVLILILFYPALILVILNERVLHFGIEIPMLDWKESWFGYSLNFFFQGSLLTLFIFGSIPSIFIVICYLATIFAQFEMLTVLIDELDELAIKNKKGANNQAIKNLIRKIVKYHLELIDFTRLLGNTFEVYYFGDFSSLVFQKTVTLFSIMSFTFIPGYLIIPTILFQLFVPCLMSTVLMMKSEKFYADICAFSWHLLPIQDQKSIQLIMIYAKKPMQLTTGLKVLNMETFVDIYKAIYSYLMLLESFK